jgi:hypothetical protein
MLRGLVLGALAFGGAFAAERLFASMGKDIARYDAMRKMSDQEPLAKELLTTVGSVIGNAVQKNGATGFVTEITNDVMRYARMKAM